ncbi:MAG: hypothetical protein OXB93_04950, partial [Cytophagales bacterium]|nr:hypothetical protein [Cytophagales bacterium]
VEAALDIKRGKYEEANRSLEKGNQSAFTRYNKGLLAVLTSEYATAKELLAQNLKVVPEHVKTHYLLAIVSARLGEEEAVLKHLKQAILLDSSFKEKAIEDLEFADFKEAVSSL